MDHPTPAPAEVYDVDTDGGLPPGGTGSIGDLAAIVTAPPVDLDEEDVAMIRAVAIDRAAERQVLAAADAFCARPTLERMRGLRAAVRTWRRDRMNHDAWPAGPIPYAVTEPAAPDSGSTAACGYCGATTPRGAFHAASLRDPSRWVCDLHAQIEAEAQMLGRLNDLPALTPTAAS